MCASFAAVAAMASLGMVAQTAASGVAQAADSGTTPMYRLYNRNSGEHFYTANPDEREHLLYEHWRDEGIGWMAPKESDTPVYRLYNPNAGDHHYTVRAAERDYLVEHGWNYEGIGWYSDDDERVPLYRQYNPNAVSGAHNYTTSAAEDDMLVSRGWNAEGVGWYAVAKGQAQQAVTMDKDGSYASIEGYMRLDGAGTGYHSKIDISDNKGAVVSFGIQYEKDIHLAYPRLASNVAFLVENVTSHSDEPGPEGKEYLYLDEAPLNKDVKVRISWYRDNSIRFYVNDLEIVRTRTRLVRPFIFAAEGSVARNGDSIDAGIHDVRIKVGNDSSSYGTMGEWNDRNDYFGLDAIISKYGAKIDQQGPYFTHGGHVQGADFVFRGTADIPGVDAQGQPWTWDTSFETVEPNTGEIGHPLSAIANIAQYRESSDDDSEW
ncbi:hypothetical protein JS528_04920 [Bifidobacterium sp. MA2]|uniref:DUF5648 domain-containing protein n=1 Tax=Bifidobacterium santillanense TaxID=2809028 RepID=A0ABS5UPB6_9BIFI|nr:hypothetical protein [Bifidobacterium santillanense]MBT1172703.1 hypothetical protein [Bifidobacterium santillanense]